MFLNVNYSILYVMLLLLFPNFSVIFCLKFLVVSSFPLIVSFTCKYQVLFPFSYMFFL